ncbi:hypothetical protein BASA81_003309 [Batrachochytrium salamandrivorans]|nr:hypothetical protein BASA81_003309 [Batrachochytrium salamandrivorans]
MHQPFAVCVTGLGEADKQLALKLAREVVDGVYQDQVDETTTHVVACKVGSPKYQRALHFSIPVVSREFLQACMEQKQVVPTRGFVLGCFAGLVLCSTGFTLEQDALKRDLVQRIETMGGGKYSGVLEKGKTTHLICASSSPEHSEKQRAAAEWNIKMVTLEWAEACLELGAWCAEEPYSPKPSKSLPLTPSTTAAAAATKPIPATTVAATPKPAPTFASNTALRRCSVFIDCPGDKERWKQLRSLATTCGASVVWEYPSSPALVTHHIICDSVPSVPSRHELVFMVSPEFLTASARFKQRASEAEFKWERPQYLPLKSKLVCVSQYGLKERSEVQRLTEEMGGEYTERLTRSNPKVALLICKPGELSEKCIRAKEWGVEIRDLAWLQELATKGEYCVV